MTPEGSSSKTWIIIIVIAVILAAAGFWYYQGSNRGYVVQELPVSELENMTNGDEAVNDSNQNNGAAATDGDVNFGTVNDLPTGSSYPDVGK